MKGGDGIYLAIDLGAGSGRVIAGIVSDGVMRLEEVARFENHAIEEGRDLFWDFETLWKSILDGLGEAVQKLGADQIRSIGVDTWGVDYGLLDCDRNLLARPRNHRDPRTRGMLKRLFKSLPKEELFKETGIQCIDINTLPQLCAETEDHRKLLEKAHCFLLMPDLVNHRLSGKLVCERTNASTTQMYHPVKRKWSRKVFEAARVPFRLAPDLIDPGCELGPLLPDLALQTGLSPETKIVTVGSHDTASAVAAVPAKSGKRFAYLSSGTWSLLGVELDEPALTKLALEHNITNEAGVFGTVRLLKNINGMWLVQECRRVWKEQGHDFSFEELADLADGASPFQAFIDPDEGRFTGRCGMPEVIADYCRETGQQVPQSRASVIRVIIDSLALKVRFVLEKLEEIVGEPVELLYIIGGGGKNPLLNQSIASSINRPVIVGPYEATAAGNVMMQCHAAGGVSDLEEGRAMIRRSFENESYCPSEVADWEKAYLRFLKLMSW